MVHRRVKYYSLSRGRTICDLFLALLDDDLLILGGRLGRDGAGQASDNATNDGAGTGADEGTFTSGGAASGATDGGTDATACEGTNAGSEKDALGAFLTGASTAREGDGCSEGEKNDFVIHGGSSEGFTTGTVMMELLHDNMSDGMLFNRRATAPIQKLVAHNDLRVKKLLRANQVNARQ